MLASLCSGQLNTLLQRNYHCSTSAGWCSFAVLSKNRGGIWKLLYSKLHRTSSSNTDSLILGKYIGIQMNGKQAVIKPILIFLTCFILMESRAVWCTYCDSSCLSCSSLAWWCSAVRRATNFSGSVPASTKAPKKRLRATGINLSEMQPHPALWRSGQWHLALSTSGYFSLRAFCSALVNVRFV